MREDVGELLQCTPSTDAQIGKASAEKSDVQTMNIR